jgi:hypothetical protein
MTRTELLQRLQTIKDKGTQALRLLELKPLSIETQAEIRRLALWIKEELHSEYNCMLPERAQRTMSVFEPSVNLPTIEETWKKSGISRLKIDGALDQKWQEPLEAVVYNAGSICLDQVINTRLLAANEAANCRAQISQLHGKSGPKTFSIRAS